MNVGDMQRKLSLWSQKNKQHRFFDLYHLLYDPDWLRLAHDYVRQNAGSVTAGCDGINMSKFDEQLDDNLQRLAQQLKAQTFEPLPVRRVLIRKANGKFRRLGIPAIGDRIVQEALRMILEPIFEADFSPYSFGFRPLRRTMDAIKCITWTTQEAKKFFWVIEGDITSYFDTINHRKLMKLMRRRIRDEKLLGLIWKFLRAGVMEGKLFRASNLGTPQGGILSPLLANIYLHELDKYMQKYTSLSEGEKTRRRREGKGNVVYVRYADDFVVLCNGRRQQVEEMSEELQTFLSKQLRLRVSREKTKITHLNEGFKFLGFWLKRGRGPKGMITKILIPKEAVRSVREKISTVTSVASHRDSVNAKILALNRIIEGWCRYYQYATRASSVFHRLEYECYWKTVRWLGKKHRLRTAQVIRRYGRGKSLATKQYRLKKATEYRSLNYKERFLKPNPYTMQRVRLERENLPQESYWTGYEARPGMKDMRPEIMQRDGYICQMCEKAVESHTAEVDHIKPVRRFKRAVDANYPENLWTLCEECHKQKTELERRTESRMR